MNKSIDSLYLQTQKLIRENEYQDNSNFENKVRRIVLKDSCLSLDKEITFNSVKNSLVKINVIIESTVEGNFSLSLNDVTIFNIENQVSAFASKTIYANEGNMLNIVSDLSGFGDLKIVIELYGNINMSNEKLINTKQINDNIYLINNQLLSKHNDIMSLLSNINNKNYYYNVKYLDHNVNIKDADNSEFVYHYIYLNNESMILSDGNNEVDLGLPDGSVCLLSSDDLGAFYNVIYILDGKTFLRVYDSEFSLVNEFQLTSIDYLNFAELKSVSSDIATNYFWAKSQDGYWYLLNVDNAGQVGSVRQYTKCDDIASYFFDGVHYVLELQQYGVVVSKFNDIILSKNEESIELKNVDNAFIFDNVLYLLIEDIVQEVQL